MTCQQVQMNLSLYLYGELDFAQEDELEQHLDTCVLCQAALAREKTLQTALNSEQRDVPLDLLSQCRRDLRSALSSAGATKRSHAWWSNWLPALNVSGTRLSAQVAVASFLVVIGFSAARWLDRSGSPGFATGSSTQMGLFDPAAARVRDIQPDTNDRVRIAFDQVSPRQIVGRINDPEIRQLLLAATKDPTDPGLRVDSVEMLNGQGGTDVRDALINSVRHDPNAAVRLKALEGLRQFAGDEPTRDTLKFVLEHDENPGVRSEAIDVLAPANRTVELDPNLAGTLQEIVRSTPEDDYVRMRSIQLLRQMNALPGVY